MKISTVYTIAIGWLLVLSSGHAHAVQDTSEDKEIELILRREREIDEERSQMEGELNRRMEPTMAALIRGDFTGVDEAAARKDADALWYVFTKAATRSIGFDEISQRYPNLQEAMAQRDALNKKIAEYARPRLAAIPGHAKMVGDRLETMSQEVGYWTRREGALRRLGLLGSMEAIQQIGRFLEDRRDPDEAASIALIQTGRSPPSSNVVGASHAMIMALGDASPVRLPKSLILSSSIIVSLQSWWKSDAAKPYREWTYETGMPMPPPQPRQAAAVMPPKAPAPVVAVPPTPAIIPTKETGIKPWMLWSLAAAGISLAVLLAMRGRRN